ncbi:LysR family transcriptional regulator [Rudaea cellulosilytica]|uniref:LysR family transcriptional regulator n=1 Tax=Rudaea cellulosilytica TaxID=540746 RepID=UPI0003656521|nr:LysR family transcriptional regulator [Rudaea cellulosilytica]
MRPLPPELLRSFVAIAQTGSFTAAAERVSLTQSTVSQHIRRLEDLLNCALFERDTRNVRLSRHGETLHRYAARILELMDDAVTAVSGPPLDGSVRLGLSEDFALSHLRLALASFVARNPGVELVIATGMSGDLFADLDAERLDLVFAKRLRGSRRGRVVRTERLYWCVGPNSPINAGAAVLPLALHPEPSVTRTRIFEVLAAADRQWRIVTVSSSIAVIKAAVIAGLGMSAFAGYVIPEGLVAIEEGLPELGALEYVIDRAASASRAVLELEAILETAAKAL